MKISSIIVGVACLHVLLLAGFFLSGGCSREVMGERSYITDPTEALDGRGAQAPQRGGDLYIEEDTTTVEEFPSTTQTSKATSSDKAVKIGSKQYTPLQDAPEAKSVAYTVVKGDSLWKIGKKFGVSVQELSAYNDIKPGAMLKVGQTLQIPPGGKLKSAASESTAPVGAATSSKAAAAPASTATASSGKYTVVKGDSLWVIAKKLGVKRSDLMAVNNLNANSVLQIGQVLVVPTGGNAAVNVPATSTTAAATSAKPAATATVTETDVIEVDVVPVGSDTNMTINVPMEVSKDMSVEEFARMNGVTVDDLRKANSSLPSDMRYRTGDVVMVPSVE